MCVNRNKLFKILLFIFLILVLLTACQTSKIKNKTSDKNDSNIHLDANIISIEADAETELLDATVYEGMAYLVSQDSLIKYDLANGERYIVAEATGNTAICADEDNIYTYNQEQNAVIKYSKAGEIISSYPFSFDPIDADRMVVFEDTMIIVAEYMNDSGYPENELYHFDLSSGKSSKITEYFKGNDSYSLIVGLDYEDKNTIMITSVATTSVMHMVVKGYRFDLQKEKVVEEFILPYANAYSYDTESAGFYYTENDLIKGYDTKSSTIITMNKVNGSSLDVERLFYANDNVIMWNNLDKRFDVVDLSSETEPLKILLSDNVSTYLDVIPIKEQFEYKYNCNVRLVEYPEDIYADKLRTKLLASDSDFDIYLVNAPTQDNLLSSILNYDLYEPLDNYDGIINNFSKMYPGIRSMMSNNDKLFGIPYEISITSSLAVQDNLGKYGYNVSDKHWSIKDVWNLCDEIIQSGEQNKSVFRDSYGMLVLVNILIQDTINKKNFSKAELTELLTDIKTYYDAGVLYDPSESKKHFCDYSVMYYWTFISHIEIPDYPEYGTILLPAFSGKNYHDLRGCAMINKFAQSKDMAAKFFEVMTNSDNIYNTYIYRDTLLGPDLTKYNIYTDWSPTELKYLSDLPSLFENAGVYTYDFLALQDYIRENVMFQFYDGTITVEEAADMIYDRVNYTYFE